MTVHAEPHAEITVSPDLLLALLEEIGKARALADHETDIIEEIVRMGLMPFRWNPRLDGALVRAATSPGAIARFARRHGITGGAAYQRLSRLRKRHARQIASAGCRG